MKRVFIVILVMVVVSGLNSTFAGVAGNALQFNGNYMHAQYVNAYNLPAYTVEMWVNMSVVQGVPLISRGEDAVSDDQHFNLSPRGTTDIGVSYENNNGTDYLYQAPVAMTANTWIHFAATRNTAGQLSLYANGNLLKSWSSTPVPTSNCQTELTFGGIWQNINDAMVLYTTYTGIMDEVRIWNVARNAAEIQANYNKLVDPESSGLVGYWNFDEGTGLLAHDISILNNSAILGFSDGSSAPTWVVSTAPIVPEPATLVLLTIGGLLLRRRIS